MTDSPRRHAWRRGRGRARRRPAPRARCAPQPRPPPPTRRAVERVPELDAPAAADDEAASSAGRTSPTSRSRARSAAGAIRPAAEPAAATMVNALRVRSGSARTSPDERPSRHLLQRQRDRRGGARHRVHRQPLGEVVTASGLPSVSSRMRATTAAGGVTPGVEGVGERALDPGAAHDVVGNTGNGPNERHCHGELLGVVGRRRIRGSDGSPGLPRCGEGRRATTDVRQPTCCTVGPSRLARARAHHEGERDRRGR